MTTYLKFDTQAQAQDLMPYAFDQTLPQVKGLTIDLVGVIHKPTGVTLTSEEGSYPEMAPIPGYYVNVITDALPAELTPFITHPATPSRVFL